MIVFIFLGCKITVDNDCSDENKDIFSLQEKLRQTRQCIKKQRHNFANKGLYSQSYSFFPVVMYGCESWTIMKAECQRIDAYELWLWTQSLRALWTAK